MIKYLLVVCLYMLVLCGSSMLVADEPWIDYDDISIIEMGSNREDVISSLGEPVLVLGSAEYDNTLYLFYNYHIKSYDNTKGFSDDKTRNLDEERSTLIKFTFVDDGLVSWEEDKMTLSMSTVKNGAKNSGIW